MGIIPNIYCTDNVSMMKRFLNGLHFIIDVLVAYCDEYLKLATWPNHPLNIIRKRRKYYPRLIDMFQHDCHALLSDIVKFCRCSQTGFETCRNPVKLNKYIHFAHSVMYYLKKVRDETPAFMQKQPKHVRQIPLR